jgi:uncharacterized membrane protein
MKGLLRAVLPLGFLALVVALLAAWEPAHAGKLPGFMLAAFVAAGKFIVLAPVVEPSVPYSTYYLATMISLMDVATALFVALYLGLLFKVPWIGTRLRALENRGRKTLEEKPSYRRWAVAGIAVFVMFPLTGTGAIGGTLFGRLMGLTPGKVLFGITLGGFSGSFGMAAMADLLARVLLPVRDTPAFKAVSYTVVAVFLLLLLRQVLKAPPHEEPSSKTAGPAPEADAAAR